MKRIVILLVCTLFIAMIIISCSKNDRGYYNYQNSNAEFNGTAYEFLQSQNGLYDSMLYVINKATGLKDSLSQGNITLFAIPNTCFTLALNNLNTNRAEEHKPLLYLCDLDSAQLDTLVCRYIIPLSITTDSINSFASGISYPSARYGHLMNLLYQRQDAEGFQGGGPQQIQFSDTKDTIFQRFWVSTTTVSVNIHVDNGIIHILSSQHEFGFGNISSGIDLEIGKKQD